MESQEYAGIAGPGSKGANYIAGEYEESHKQQLPNQLLPTLKVRMPV